jgi:predicted ferric reductase
MSEQALPLPRAAALPVVRRRAAAVLLSAFLAGNVAAIVFLWVHGGNWTTKSAGDVLTSGARLTGLLSAFLALVQVVLLARLPALERLAGFDRLTVWHRWNGHACIDLVVAHVVLSVWGYALLDRFSIPKEISTMLGGGIYPGMITATIGTALLIAVVLSSVVIVKRRLRYEWWYAVHITAYAGIALAWFHQIPTGNELVLDRTAADYWRSLYLATIAVLVVWRVLVPAAAALRHRLRVLEVVREGADVVSVTIGGRALDRLDAKPGQFFIWRFLARRRALTAHPFSLSRAPDGRTLRITVKALGDHTASFGELKPGTRVVAEGPFGIFTRDARRRQKTLLIAGGIGITPVRALAEQLDSSAVVLYRVVSESDIVFRAELDELAARRGFELHYVVGDHATPEGARLLTPAHLEELVPDIAGRDVFVCGPRAMTDHAVRHVRAAGVPRRFIHAERFAL